LKIKKTTFYALQIIRRIYLEENKVVTSKFIAEKENLSQGVVHRVLRTLGGAGMMKAHQGRGMISGGFSMIKKIDEITLLDVVDSMENVDICHTIDEESREKESTLFDKCDLVNEHLKAELSKYTVRDLFGL